MFAVDDSYFLFQSKRMKMSQNTSPTHNLTVLLVNGENLAARDSNGYFFYIRYSCLHLCEA